MRAVRIAETALEDIDTQVSGQLASDFRRLDLVPVLDALAQDVAIWDEVGVAHGPGRRFTISGRTVAGFHVFVVEDVSDPRPGASVVYAIDIWLEDFPA